MDSRNRVMLTTLQSVNLASFMVLTPMRREYQAEPEFRTARRKRRYHPTLADSLGKRRFIKSSKR